ncbi:MAG: phosphate signaling complex protein PhoU [Polyangiaceae bacterium]|jgi:phosphate transport system protein
MSDPPVPHLSRDFDAEMRTVREQFAAMASRCRDQLHLALEGFWTEQNENRAVVEASDAVVDSEEKAIDALTLQVLALRSPAGSDLRTLTATFKLVTDVERIGDEAVDIAREGAAQTGADTDPVRARLKNMAERTENLFNAAVSSFLGRDASAAEQASGVNRAIDAIYDEVVGHAIGFMARNPRDVASALAFVNVATCLRRIADHAQNIAEGTLFVVRGDVMPR